MMNAMPGFRRLPVAFAFVSAALAGDGDWPHWRGPNDDGMARGDAPLHWSDEEHIAWKAAVPGRGHSSPVVWADRLFLTTAVPIGNASGGGYTLTGDLVWQKDFARLNMFRDFGEGAWTALDGDKLLVLLDQEGDSFLLALDKNNGRELWRTPRLGNTNWSGPYVTSYEGRKQVIVSASREVCAYDLESGKRIWSARGLGQNTIPSRAGTPIRLRPYCIRVDYICSPTAGCSPASKPKPANRITSSSGCRNRIISSPRRSGQTESCISRPKMKTLSWCAWARSLKCRRSIH